MFKYITWPCLSTLHHLCACWGFRHTLILLASSSLYPYLYVFICNAGDACWKLDITKAMRVLLSKCLCRYVQSDGQITPMQHKHSSLTVTEYLLLHQHWQTTGYLYILHRRVILCLTNKNIIHKSQMTLLSGKLSANHITLLILINKQVPNGSQGRICLLRTF